MDKNEIRVLYVDDEENNLIAFRASFRRHFKVYTAISASVATEILEQTNIHVLITDQRTPGTTGSELLRRAVLDYPDQIRILLTGYSDIEALTDAVNMGKIHCYLQKPWNDEELKDTINNAFQIYRSKREKDEMSNTLSRTNEQLEFYLRQKLLS